MNDTINEILNNSDFLITVSDSINNSIHQLNIDLLKNQNEVLNSINQLKRPNYSLLLIGALIGALIGYLISLLHDRVRIRKKLKNYKKRYEEYVGIYLVYKKYEMDEPYYCFNLKREKNTFIIENGVSKLGFEEIYSVISMHDFNPNYGNGYYRHKPNNKGIIRYGFWEIQLDKDRILAHETIYYKEGQVSSPYVWVKQRTNSPTEFLKNIRIENKQIINENK